MLHPTQDVAITGSADGTIQIWTTAGDTRHVIKAHSAPLVAVCLHPTTDYVLGVDSAGVFSLSDVLTGETLLTETDEGAVKTATCAQWHPDGTLFAIGTSTKSVHLALCLFDNYSWGFFSFDFLAPLLTRSRLHSPAHSFAHSFTHWWCICLDLPTLQCCARVEHCRDQDGAGV